MLALLMAVNALAAAQPTLAVVDATEKGAPEVAAEVTRVATATRRFDVRPREEIDAAVLEARKVGAACGIDDPPECWARLGIMAELDRILVIAVREQRVELLLVDVPARTAARTSADAGATIDDAKAAAGDALRALLEGKAAPPETRRAKTDGASGAHGGAFWAGAIVGVAGAVVLVGCATAATLVSAELAAQLHAAKDDGVPLSSSYGALDATFWVLAAGAAAGGVAAIAGGALFAVSE